MKLSDIKDGMKLKGVGTYADECIEPGKIYEVFKLGGELHITCGCGGPHELSSSTDSDGNIPELEPAD